MNYSTATRHLRAAGYPHSDRVKIHKDDEGEIREIDEAVLTILADPHFCSLGSFAE
jgi:hypothetical protein